MSDLGSLPTEQVSFIGALAGICALVALRGPPERNGFNIDAFTVTCDELMVSGDFTSRLAMLGDEVVEKAWKERKLDERLQALFTTLQGGQQKTTELVAAFNHYCQAHPGSKPLFEEASTKYLVHASSGH